MPPSAAPRTDPRRAAPAPDELCDPARVKEQGRAVNHGSAEVERRPGAHRVEEPASRHSHDEEPETREKQHASDCERVPAAGLDRLLDRVSEDAEAKHVLRLLLEATAEPRKAHGTVSHGIVEDPGHRHLKVGERHASVTTAELKIDPATGGRPVSSLSSGDRLGVEVAAADEIEQRRRELVRLRRHRATEKRRHEGGGRIGRRSLLVLAVVARPRVGPKEQDDHDEEKDRGSKDDDGIEERRLERIQIRRQLCKRENEREELTQGKLT